MTTTTTYYFDMDGVLANFHEYKDGWRMAGRYNFIRNLNPFVDAVNLVNELIANGTEVYISSLCMNDAAKQAKIDWLAQYIPTLNADHIIIMVGNAKKHDNMRTYDGILVDDKLTNVKAWRKAGHKAVYVEEKGVVDLTTAE